MKFLTILLSIFILSGFINASEEIPTKEEVAQLYVATFNRAPDDSGLDYWVNDSKLTLSNIAKSFFDQEETQEKYPSNTSNRDFIKMVYQNLFNRDPEMEGLNYWEDNLAGTNNYGYNPQFSKIPKDKFILAVINGAKDNDTSKDKTILNNKSEIGLYFSEQGLKNIDQAKIVLEGITDKEDSVVFIKEQISKNDIVSNIWNSYSDTKISFSTVLQDSFKAIVDDKFNKKRNTAGLTISVYNGKEDSWRYAKGKANESSLMTTDTPVRLYSISKTITGAEILKLIDNGQLNLNDTLTSILSNHKDFDSFDRKKINLDATIEQLLTHTSGIKEYSTNTTGVQSLVMFAMFGQEWSPLTLLNLIEEDFSNVGDFSYSGSNSVLLGMVIEHLTGKNLNQKLKDDIFTTNNSNVIIPPQDSLPSSIAEPYDDKSIYGGEASFGNLLSVQSSFNIAVNLSGWNAYGMLMTADNVAKFGYGFYSVNGNIISSNLRTELINSTKNSDDYGYATSTVTMELQGNTVNIYGHGGGGAGYLTILYYSPEADLSIAILTNSNNQTNNQNIDVLSDGDLYEICVDIFNKYEELKD